MHYWITAGQRESISIKKGKWRGDVFIRRYRPFHELAAAYHSLRPAGRRIDFIRRVLFEAGSRSPVYPVAGRYAMETGADHRLREDLSHAQAYGLVRRRRNRI